ncbi:MAG: FG-GAP-like repeat-containing protein, partial [Planctomycetota bacterium]
MGDLDDDGDLDLAVANRLSTDVSVLMNNGDGTFAEDVIYPVTGIEPWHVATGDLDGDLDLDLVVSKKISNDISILWNSGDGTFGGETIYDGGDWPY